MLFYQSYIRTCFSETRKVYYSLFFFNVRRNIVRFCRKKISILPDINSICKYIIILSIMIYTSPPRPPPKAIISKIPIQVKKLRGKAKIEAMNRNMNRKVYSRLVLSLLNLKFTKTEIFKASYSRIHTEILELATD